MFHPKQMVLFANPQSHHTNINIRKNHELVRLSDLLPWPRLMEIAYMIRESKAKYLSGPQPHYRELLPETTNLLPIFN